MDQKTHFKLFLETPDDPVDPKLGQSLDFTNILKFDTGFLKFRFLAVFGGLKEPILAFFSKFRKNWPLIRPKNGFGSK